MSALRHQRMNSSRPNWLVSTLRQAGSRRVGRCWIGPTLSSQRKPDTKLPPGYLTTVTPKFSDQVQEVCSEVVLVRVGVTGLVDSGVDATAHVFDEATENAPIDGRDDETRFEDEFGGEHSIPSEINASNPHRNTGYGSCR